MRLLSLGTLCLRLRGAGASEPPLAERVNRAIDRGVDWLRTKQAESGSFGPIGGRPYEGGTGATYDYPAGVTALALYTLLKCGVPVDDPAVRKGFAFLRKQHTMPDSTYEAAMVILALEATADPHKRERAREAAARRGAKKPRLRADDRKWIERLVRQLAGWWRDGGWRYRDDSDPPFGVMRDMHNTQFAMMGLAAAHRAGVEVDREIVLGTVAWVLGEQERSGPRHERWQPPAGEGRATPAIFDDARGWAYARGSPHDDEPIATGVMTTAGIVVLALGRRMLEDLDPKRLKTLEPGLDRAIRDGVAWLDLHWDATRNPPGKTVAGRTRYRLLWLYGVERVGDLLGVHLIGAHDWYREGAEVLLQDQKGDGRWEDRTTHAPHDLLNTCFALLFLDRATLSVTTETR